MLVDIYAKFGPEVQDCGTRAVLHRGGKNHVVAELTPDGWLTTQEGRNFLAEEPVAEEPVAEEPVAEEPVASPFAFAAAAESPEAPAVKPVRTRAKAKPEE